MKNLQNQYLEFSTDKMQITEEVDSDKNKWLNISGTALVSGKSRNNRIYTDANLKENDGREFKYIVNHPVTGEAMKSEQVVGKGTLHYVDGVLRHEGRIRDTVSHPDVTSRVADDLLDPSIGATFASMDAVEEDGEKVFKLSGTEINHIAFVAYPGVKSATIEVAAEESFNAHNTLNEENDEAKIKNNGDEVMEEEKNYKKLFEELVAKTIKEEAEAKNQIIEDLKKRVQVLEEAPAEEKKEEEKPKEEDKVDEAKESGVGQIVTEEAEVRPQITEDKDGVTMATEAYNKFNNEIREIVGKPQK